MSGVYLRTDSEPTFVLVEVARGPVPKLQQHMERISQLPKPRQRMVMEMLDAVLAQPSQ